MRAGLAAFAVVLGAGCAAGGREPVAGPVPGEEPRPALPSIAPREGALQLDLVYPPEEAVVASRDSTFVFGSTGTGQASLTINGQRVEVSPNGAYLAYLPVPADGVYRLEGAVGGQMASLVREVRVPAPVSPPTGARILQVLRPTGTWAVAHGSAIEVAFRGSSGGRATIALPDGRRIALLEEPAGGEALSNAGDFTRAGEGARTSSPTGISVYRALVPAMPLTARDTAVGRPLFGSLDPPAGAKAEPLPPAARGALLELVVGADTARMPLRLTLALYDPLMPRTAVVSGPSDRHWRIRGRPHTSGPFHWFWPAGTRLTVVEQRNDMVAVRLADDLVAWVPVSDVRLLAEGTPPPGAVLNGARFTPRPGWVELRLPLGTRLPYHVEEDVRTLTLDVYGAVSAVNFFQYGSLDPLIERAEWSQPADSTFRVNVRLTEPVWGYEAAYEGDALVLRIRRPPQIDARRPLAGLLIVVDAGHPPGGAIGPTRLTEAEANLAIARRLAPMLEAAGARVLLTRTDDSAVPLGARPEMAIDADGHILVSVHNNAFPDGVNPFENAGTSVYYYHPHSQDLAALLQRELLAELGLRDIGIGRADLALARPTWMPSALTETMFLMVPQQEHALRQAEVHERIARAHLRALETFARDRARR